MGGHKGRARVQRALADSMALFIELMRWVGVLTYEVRGREHLTERGQLIVANHPSLIDVVFIVSLLPQVDCIVKAQLWRNPFLRWPVIWAGYIRNTIGNELVAQCAASLRQGRSLLLFPEGTRTRPGQSFSMQRGAAQIAIASGLNLRAITISCYPPMLGKNVPWYRVPAYKAHWIINVHPEPIDIQRQVSAEAGTPLPRLARHITKHLEQWFTSSVAAQLPESIERARHNVGGS